MTFLSRRKRRTIPPAAPARRARRITSNRAKRIPCFALLSWLLVVASASAQAPSFQMITPKFTSAQPWVVPAHFTDGPGKAAPGLLPPQPQMRGPATVEDADDQYVRTE